MKKKIRLSLITGLLILSLCLVPGLFTTAAAAQPPDDFVPGEVIVGFKANIGMAQAQSALTSVMPKINCRIKRTSVDVLGGQAGTQAQRLRSEPSLACLIELSDKSSKGMTKAITELKKANGVRYTEPNYIARIPEPEASAEPQSEPELDKDRPPVASIQRNTNDPMLAGAQWGYYDIWADLTPEFPRKAPTIAVVDTGVDYNHPDLKGQVIKGPDLVNGDNDPMDDNGHGTHVAGIAAAIANNYIGITGISPTSKIYAVKVINSVGWGTYYDVGLGIITAANRSDVKVINLSLGGPSESTWLYYAVEYAWGMGKVICAAAGNSDNTTPLYPACYDNCIAVAANTYDPRDGKAWFSNYGDWVDIAAPGQDIVSTLPAALTPYGQEYWWWSGTSMATPHVAGAAARVWAQNTSWTNSKVRNQLETTVDLKPLETTSGWPEPSPFGHLNLFKALGGSLEGKGALVAVVLDGTTGNPVVGANMQVKLGRTVVATDTVTSYGYTWVLLNAGTYSVTFSKSGYSTVTLSNIVIEEGVINYLGIIPMVTTAKWTLVIVWPTVDENCTAVLYVPEYRKQGPYWVNGLYWAEDEGPGCATAYPYARFNRWTGAGGILGRDDIPLDSISIIKELTVTEPYLFFGYNDNGTGFDGCKAWIYAGKKLVAIVDAPSDPGYEWDIGSIYKGKWTYIGTVSEAGGEGFQSKSFPSEKKKPEDIATIQ